MAVYLLKLVKPLAVSALLALILVHFTSPLDAATGSVAAFWLLSMLIF